MQNRNRRKRRDERTAKARGAVGQCGERDENGDDFEIGAQACRVVTNERERGEERDRDAERPGRLAVAADHR